MNVDELIDQNVPEGPEIEYKHPDEELDDIVKELASMANSGGGDIIIGVVEDDGEIRSLEPVENPGRLEENVQQKIGSKVTPKLPITYNTNTYRGDWEEYLGTRLMTFSVDGDRRLYAYQIQDRHVFPTRLGSTTHYMDGTQVVDFYENGIYPGQKPESQVRNESSVGTAIAEVLDTVATTATDASSKSPDETPEQVDSESPEFSPSRKPYHFTPSGDYTAVTFYSALGLYQPHGFEGVSTYLEPSEVPAVLASLKNHVDAEIESGAFTITQRNGAWFGHGAGNFIEALDQSTRYDSVPADYGLDNHHSEGTIFITRMRDGYVVIRARDGVGGDYIEEFTVNFLTAGVPLDNRNITSFLEENGLELQSGYRIEINDESYHPGSDKLWLTPVEQVESPRRDGWASKIVCENPFHDNPSLLDPLLEEQGWERYEPFTTYEYVTCKLANHHPMGEVHEYYLRRANLQDFTDVQGTIPHQNVSLMANW